jgi:hypothetical protein
LITKVRAYFSVWGNERVEEDLTTDSRRAVIFNTQNNEACDLKGIVRADMEKAVSLPREFFLGIDGKPAVRVIPDGGSLVKTKDKLAAWQLQGAEWLPEDFLKVVEREYNLGKPLRKMNILPGQKDYRESAEFKDIPDDEYVYFTIIETKQDEFTGWPVKTYTPAYHYSVLIAPKSALKETYKFTVVDINQQKQGVIFGLQITVMPLLNQKNGAIKWDKIAIAAGFENQGFSSRACAGFAKNLSEKFGGARIMIEAVNDKALGIFRKEFDQPKIVRARPKDAALSLANGEVWEAVIRGGQSIDGGINEKADTKGGIDFRGLPIANQAVGAALNPAITRLPSINIADLDKEWKQIEKMSAGGMTPSTDRIVEFLGACQNKGQVAEYLDSVLACIADIMREEEAEAQNTDPLLKNILVKLESGVFTE